MVAPAAEGLELLLAAEVGDDRGATADRVGDAFCPLALGWVRKAPMSKLGLPCLIHGFGAKVDPVNHKPLLGPSGDVIMTLDSGEQKNLGWADAADDFRRILIMDPPNNSKRLRFSVPVNFLEKPAVFEIENPAYRAARRSAARSGGVRSGQLRASASSNPTHRPCLSNGSSHWDYCRQSTPRKRVASVRDVPNPRDLTSVDPRWINDRGKPLMNVQVAHFKGHHNRGIQNSHP